MVVDVKQKKFILLSGMPRTGSSLLVAILTQNPIIYGEGASSLCQIMWDVKRTFENTTALAANNKHHTEHDILSALPGLYYKDIENQVIIEKGRTWTNPLNFEMWKNHVCEDQKIIVMTRDARDIVKSLVSLRINNGWSGDLYSDILEPGSEPIWNSAHAIFMARQHLGDRLIFIDYKDMVSDTNAQIDKIYKTFGLEKFEHKLEGISLKNKENDEVHGLIGMHDVRESISVRPIDVELPEYIEGVCHYLNNMIYGDSHGALC